MSAYVRASLPYVVDVSLVACACICGNFKVADWACWHVAAYVSSIRYRFGPMFPVLRQGKVHATKVQHSRSTCPTLLADVSMWKPSANASTLGTLYFILLRSRPVHVSKTTPSKISVHYRASGAKTYVKMIMVVLYLSSAAAYVRHLLGMVLQQAGYVWTSKSAPASHADGGTD